MFYEGSRIENDNKEQLLKIFRRNEEGLLLHGLKECHRVAVLLPRDKCANFSKILLKQGKSTNKHVDIGKEVYFQGCTLDWKEIFPFT